MKTPVLISSTYLLKAINDFDFENDSPLSIQLDNGGDFIISSLSGEDINLSAHYSNPSYFHFELDESQLKNMIRILRSIPEQPIMIYLGNQIEIRMTL